MPVKRYDLVKVNDDGCGFHHDHVMEPSKDGDWVRWEDGFGSPLTLEEVIAETSAYFDAGNGNAALRDPILSHMQNKKEVPHAVLVSLGFKRITAYQRTKPANEE